MARTIAQRVGLGAALSIAASSLSACSSEGEGGVTGDVASTSDANDASVRSDLNDQRDMTYAVDTVDVTEATDARTDATLDAGADLASPRDSVSETLSDVTGDLFVDATDASTWRLVWSDEFDGPDGSAADSKKWTFDTGGGGWGNAELETYTSRTDNAHVQAGALWIVARKETFKGADGISRDYTSARLVSKGLFEHTYGRYEARIQIPYGQGIWPAFWMLGNDLSSSGWPKCGEIDLMENIGREPAIVHGTLHGLGYSGSSGLGASYSLAGKPRFADAFHVYSIDWTATSISFSVDGIVYSTRTPADLPSGAKWAFDHPFFLLLNVAVGGSWPGSPDGTTVFPQVMKVDWVRVYDKA